MILIILSIIFALLISFLEPVLYIPFGISLFICIGAILTSNKIGINSIIFLVISSIILDLTTKNVLGSYLIAFSIYILLVELGKRISSEGTILFGLIKQLSIFFSLVFLSLIFSKEYTNVLLLQNIFPAVVTYIVVIIFEKLFSNFNRDNSLSKIKL